ncbi:MAG TPA: ATP-binding protein, partial [Urbifossiella sp.]|nr:ATP-binding protein [Urbifossiella sp.]
EFEFLKVLCEMAGSLLAESRRWEKAFRSKTEWMERSAEEVTRDTCHHVATNLAAFPALLSEFRLITDGDQRFRVIDAEFQTFYDHVSRMIVGTRDRILVAGANRQREDFVAVIRSAFDNNPEYTWDLATAPAALPIDLDRPKFESALLQLIHNAQQCQVGSQQVRLAVRVHPFTRAGELWVRLEVGDNGPGVPAEYKQAIFKQFFSRRPNGTSGNGVGLWFVKRVVSAHGGTVVECGSPPNGACFRIELPQYGVEAPG